jgi:predicted O-linked N-acetylglucosamine transferase (SPINDLY family)
MAAADPQAVAWFQHALQRLQQGDSQALPMLAHLAQQPAWQLRAAVALAQWHLHRRDVEAACRWSEHAHRAPDAGLPALLLHVRCLRQAGRADEAAALCEGAGSALGWPVELMMAWSLSLRDADQADRAEAVCRQALSAHPDHPGLLHNLGTLLCQRGDVDGARAAWLRCTDIQPEQGASWFELVKLAEAAGDLPAARALLVRAAPLLPGHVEVWRASVRVCRALREWDQALAAQQQVIALAPQDAEAHIELARMAVAVGSLPLALQAAQAGARLSPTSPQPRYWQAQVLRRLGQPLAAIDMARQAMELGAEGDLRAESLYLLTISQIECGQLTEAKAGLDELRRCARTDSERAVAFDVQAAWSMARGDAAASLSAWQQSTALWPGRFAADQSLCAAAQYADTLMPADLRALAVRCMESHQRTAADAVWLPNTPQPERRMRIGYLSADFRRHSCAFFLEPLLATHDPESVEVFAYANQHQVDDMTRRMQALVPNWRFVAQMDDVALRQQIRDDAIDVLIDLSGFTEGGRLKALTQRVAPLQLTWLGYLGTTGLKCIDARLSDADVNPASADAWQTEAVWRLPRSYLCFRPDADAPEVGVTPALARGHVTFGSFNVLQKISLSCLRMWAELMHRVPSSRLVLKARALADEGTRAHWLQRFADEGIAADRLDLRGWQPEPNHHLQAYHDIDIALDTWPYNGVTTTCEALWMGVPVLSLEGEVPVARQGRTLLNAVRLSDWCATTAEDWVERGVALAGDVPALQALRATLRQRMTDSPLRDEVGFARAFEATVRAGWQRWCAGRV